MLVGSETPITKCNVLTSNTFIDCFVFLNFFEHAAIAIIIIANANLLIINTLDKFVLLLPDLLNSVLSLFIPTQRTLNHSIILQLILHPLTKTIQMKGIPTNVRTGGDRIRLHNLHMTDRTQIL